MDIQDDFNYQGPDLNYKPHVKDLSPRTTRLNTEIPTRGYYDLDYLNKILDDVSNRAAEVYAYAEKELAGFSIKVDTSDQELVTAHDLVYPNDVTPGYITFDEYKYLLTASQSVAVDYVRSFYENKLRGVNGTGALDLLLLARTTHAEVARIRAFISTYIGELDETAEFRIIELFQDWAETAEIQIQRIDKTVKTQVTAEISRTELDELTPELSTKYQALFQTKLNQINSLISETIGKLEKNWDSPSSSFYDNNLGLALLFQIKIANDITDPNNLTPSTLPLLSEEARGVVSGLAANYTVALSDQMRRNQLYSNYLELILNNTDQRDVYKRYINQLADKGKEITSSFVDSSDVDQSDSVLNAPHPLSHVENNTSSSSSVYASHQDLLDRLLDDAHPQYLLKSGGTITGDIETEPGVKVGGIVPSTHKHDGKDGSAKISGTDLLQGTITDENVDPSPTTPVPYDLALAGQVATVVPPGITKVAAEISFQIETTANIVSYEFEVIKLDN